ncbi:uncharacterized protein LOC127859812 [Dreissena polymorpha]|uniref:uncharacterized protein LOC127859812 n=1 Tax=Dreissena polymorpha TaxID=45954 RepID=UPI002264DEA1|nr:uncharacterized protein LOC127859812 [Dreissena polymorpha]
MAAEAGLPVEKRLTNRSTRKHLVQKLREHNFPATEIMSVTVHTNLKTSATKYVHQSDVRVKRGVTSPLTANTLNPGPLIAKHNRSRKKQTLLSPAKEALLQEISAGKDSTSVLLQELRTQSSSLTSRTQIFCSVLHKFRDISRLEDSIDHFTDEIIKEMMKRVPLLLKVILCVATPASKNMKPSILPAIASAYSILMKHKCDNLSAYHRLTTIIAIKGGLDERLSLKIGSALLKTLPSGDGAENISQYSYSESL